MDKGQTDTYILFAASFRTFAEPDTQIQKVCVHCVDKKGKEAKSGPSLAVSSPPTHHIHSSRCRLRFPHRMKHVYPTLTIDERDWNSISASCCKTIVHHSAFRFERRGSRRSSGSEMSETGHLHTGTLRWPGWGRTCMESELPKTELSRPITRFL